MLLKKLNFVTDIDTSNLAAESKFILFKAEVYRTDINKLVNVSTGLNNLKVKVDDFRHRLERKSLLCS